jgi:hypothetical protein
MTGDDRATNEIAEPPDHHSYVWITFYRHTIEFFVSAAKYYEGLLDAELTQIEADVHLKALLRDEVRREFRVDRGREEAVRVREWLEDKLAKSSEHSYDCDLHHISHGTIRYLKSIGLLYLGYVKKQRNSFSLRKNVSKHMLAAIDREITVYEEFLTSKGVFAYATPMSFLADEDPPAKSEIEPQKLDETRRPKPVLVESIEILDLELRSRCLDLFNRFEELGQPNRHDTVVTEATRILENRLRTLTKAPDGCTGNELAARAFAGNSPALRVSPVAAEQEAVHLLFRGAFGFIRNRVHHRLHSDMSSERVLQILGLIDYLISLANSGLPRGPDG